MHGCVCAQAPGTHTAAMISLIQIRLCPQRTIKNGVTQEGQQSREISARVKSDEPEPFTFIFGVIWGLSHLALTRSGQYNTTHSRSKTDMAKTCEMALILTTLW